MLILYVWMKLTYQKIVPINVNGFIWFGHNRQVKHVRVDRASGGVDWLVTIQFYKIIPVML